MPKHHNLREGAQAAEQRRGQKHWPLVGGRGRDEHAQLAVEECPREKDCANSGLHPKKQSERAERRLE
eukprot:scaffold170310_cov28-Tisochrysis_lutea.AAC.2